MHSWYLSTETSRINQKDVSWPCGQKWKGKMKPPDRGRNSWEVIREKRGETLAHCCGVQAL